MKGQVMISSLKVYLAYHIIKQFKQEKIHRKERLEGFIILKNMITFPSQSTFKTFYKNFLITCNTQSSRAQGFFQVGTVIVPGFIFELVNPATLQNFKWDDNNTLSAKRVLHCLQTTGFKANNNECVSSLLFAEVTTELISVFISTTFTKLWLVTMGWGARLVV